MAERLSNGTRNALLASMATTYANGILEIRTGTQPASAEDIETGTLLVRISLASGTVVPGVATNGINFGTPAAGVMNKAAAETWSGVGLAAGTAGWFRFYTNNYHTGADTDDTKIRFDGACSTSNAELNMSNLVVAIGATVTVTSLPVTCPAS